MYCVYNSNPLHRHYHRFPPFPLPGGNFLYTEANGRDPGEKARIYSPFDSPANEAGTDMTMISFWYSMWDGFDGGSPFPKTNMGTLNVYIAYGGEKVPAHPPVWSRSGSQTDRSGWKEAKILFTAPSPFRVGQFLLRITAENILVTLIFPIEYFLWISRALSLSLSLSLSLNHNDIPIR